MCRHIRSIHAISGDISTIILLFCFVYFTFYFIFYSFCGILRKGSCMEQESALLGT
jgi:hypothetical protein